MSAYLALDPAACRATVAHELALGSAKLGMPAARLIVRMLMIQARRRDEGEL